MPFPLGIVVVIKVPFPVAKGVEENDCVEVNTIVLVFGIIVVVDEELVKEQRG